LSRQSSSVALTRESDSLLAYVADPDALRIEVIDVRARKLVASTSTSGPVEQLLVLPSGHLLASISNSSYLEVFAPKSDKSHRLALESECAVDVPSGPFAMALRDDGRRVAVTGLVAGSLTFLRSEDLAIESATALPRAPAGVAFVGSRAYVSHLVGSTVSIVDSETPQAIARTVPTRLTTERDYTSFGAKADPSLPVHREGNQAFSLIAVDSAVLPTGEAQSLRGAAPRAQLPSRSTQSKGAKSRVVVPMISVDAGDPTRPTEHYYGPPPTFGVPKQAPTGFVIDTKSEKGLSRSLVAAPANFSGAPCYSPRSVAYDGLTQSLYVTCLGAHTLLELDATSADPMREVKRSFKTSRGPTGVAIASEEGLAVVSGRFDGRVSIIDLATGDADVVDPAMPLSELAAATHDGRDLFFRAGDRQIAFDGLACASCHLEGAEDGLTWSTPIGSRQTLMLSGRIVNSAPYGWTRKDEELEAYVTGTMSRLGGEGLPSTELSSLLAYVAAIPSLPQPTRDPALFAEGEAVFAAKGCTSCHPGGEPSGSKLGLTEDTVVFDTPSLHRVGLSAPYYHDGRYPDLRALLSDKSSAMGRTAELSSHEVNVLESYLRSL
jgi:DNA-binding beta-propeller fold protein YncE/mono/diheme cytochrome c family protein